MPMKDVHLVNGEQVDPFVNEFGGHEVPRAVEHHSAPAKARMVLNNSTGNLPRDFRYRCSRKNLHGEKLPKRLQAVEQPAGRLRNQLRSFRRYLDSISFLSQSRKRRIDLQGNTVRWRGGVDDAKVSA